MVALDLIYSLAVKQNMFGQNIENIFFYEAIGDAGSAGDLRAAWNTALSVSMRNLQSAQLNWTEIDTTNLGDLADFEKFPFAVGGLAGDGDTLPAFNAVGYTLNPLTRAVRPGSKRIAGILEAVQLNGVLTEPTYVGHVEDFRLLLDDVVVGALTSYQPVIVKRVKVPVPDTEPPQFTYRLPKPPEDATLGLVKSATSSLIITSQVSRRP